MKLKQFIFALVAMLSFSFSSFAQTVTTAADLKAALNSTGAVVTLGDNITMTETISIPTGVSVTLDLNGKNITTSAACDVFEVVGTMVINDSKGTGSVTGKTNRVLYVKAKGKLTINGGRFFKNSGRVVYSAGKLIINGGSVETTPEAALNVNTAAITSATGTLVLNGGTVTSIAAQTCDLKIAGATVEAGVNILKTNKSTEITAGTINGNVTIAPEAAGNVTVSGGSFEDKDAIKDYLPSGSALLEKPDGTFEVVAGLLKIGNEYYPTLAAALAAAEDGATIELINQEGSVIAMNGSLCGKSVTITGTAKVDWSKGFLFVARGGAGNATLTFDNANLTSASNQATYGIHVSGREKDTADKYDGTLVIKNSAIELDYLINKGAMTLNNSSLTVKNGFDLNGRPASETENGEDANATLALTNGSKLVVNNHNGMGIGREGKGELTVDATSTFEHTQDFIVRANGTMDVKGTLVSNGKKLTNNGEVKFTDTKLTAATIEGTGTTRFYNDVNFYGANSITTTEINGTPFHLVVNEGANLFITRFVLGYDRNITVNGTIADAFAFNPEGQTPSLKFNSTSGVSVGGTGTGNLTVKNAYVELGNSSWKNAQGTYDWDFVNSYVSATSFTNATGADAATWDVTFDKSVLAAKNYIKNGKNVTYNFTNNSRGTTGSLRIDGKLNIDATSSVVTTSQQNNKVGAVDEHGGINGTVNVAGNLTIGSNAKTQLEVLGGTVNVKEGATLALGNNTLTLDATSAMQSAGNISGAITAADGANVAISGGTYTQNVDKWCAEGFMTQQNADGSYGIAKAVAKVGDKKYASLEEAFKAATSDCTIEIVSDVTVDYAWDARYTGGKFTVPVTIDGNGKTIKFTASVNDNNYQAPFRFEADATVKNLIVDMSDVTDNRFRAISSKGNLTVDNSKFIGKDESLNCRAIIFGEGAGANVGNLAIAITNSEFINWKRGITDNENAQDVKTVTITGNTLTDAGVGVSAKEKVTFTGNTVEGAYVNIKSYTAGNKLAVTATDNTLEANTDETGKFNVIDAGGVVNAEGFNIVAKGGSIIGYTSTEGIYGEVWGNSRESFVIKVVDAQGNVMGTTSLNNIGGIINGNVNVLWNLKFNAAANTDEYWTMEWTTAPSIDNMPARVALWVDGVEVSGGPVVLNGPDNLWPIYAAVTDADGKIISCHTSVADAAAVTGVTNIALLRDTDEAIMLPSDVTLNYNGFTANNVTTPVASVNNVGYATLADAMAAAKAGDVVTVFAGTYAMPSMKAGITIEGKGEVVFEGTLTGTLENLTMKNIHIKGANAQRWAYAKGNLVFENVTFEATSVYAIHFDGIAEGTNLTYKNCTIIGWAAMGGSPESCVFEGCTIKDNGTYGVIRTYFDAEIKNCTFDVANVNTNDAYQDGIHAVDGAEVVVDNCTNANENGTMKDLVNISGTSVITVDGKVYKNVAQIGETKYITIEDAIAAWTNNTTLTLLADVTLNDVITLNSTEHHILNLGTYTMTAADGKNAIVIKACGTGSAERSAITINADAENPGGINAGSKCVIYYKYADGGISAEDRPIIKINGGVFTGSTSSFGTAGIYTIGTAARKCATLNITGGTFNCSINGSGKSKLIISGGVFNYSVGSQGDSTALRLISGGTFKTFGFMTADSNNTKFWFGTSMGNSNVGVHVDDNGYIVVGGAVVTEPGDKFEASSTNYSGANSLLQYSSAKDNGLYYTAVEEALADNNKTTGVVTVYADEVDMNGTNFKGTIIIPADGKVTITNAPADLKVKTQDGYFLNVDENGTYTSMRAVAKVGDKEFETVQKALQYAIDNSAAEVVVLTDVREKMETDFDLVIKANLTIKAADKFTAEAPAKVEFYNEGTSMDFAVGTADGAERCTLTIAENVHFDLVDRVIWLGYYGNNVDVVVNGYFGGYQIWHGANTTVNNGGMLDSHGEAFIMRRNATLTANEGAKVKANYFQIYSGHINATGADITAGLVWVDGAHSYGSEGNVSFTLNNTSFVSNGEVKMTVAEGKNIPVSVTNGSAFTAKGKMTLANSVDVTVDATSSITHNNGQAFKLPVATINGLKYTSLQDAVNAVKNGETIVLVDVVTENVTLTEKVGLHYTLDGAGKQFKGSISVNSLSDTNDNRRITIKNIKFVDDSAAKVDFITSVNTNHYPRLTVEGCTFTGSGDATDVAVRLKSSHSVVINDCTGTGLHSFLQNTSGWNLTIKGVTVTNSKSAFALGTVQGVTVQGVKVDVKGYGIRLDANTYNNNAEIVDNAIKAFIPVVVRDVNTTSNVIFAGKNEFTAGNTDGKWCVIGTTEYEENGKLPAEVAAGNVVVTLKDEKLTYDGIHGAGLAGKGTAEAPYLINNVAELEIFRASVNAGSTKYNAPGLWVALNADIDLANAEWTVGIGDGHNYSFDGNFDGKKYTIKNLNIKPYADADNYICAGLFGYTYGAVTIKNLVIENAKVEFTGAEDGKTYHNVGVLVGFANNKDGKLNVDNVTVKGDIKVDAPQTYGVGAIVGYSYRDMGAITNTNVLANKGSYIKGQRFVAGITGYSYNGAVIDNCTVENLAITGEIGVGGIAGLALNDNKIAGCTVKYVTVNGDKNVAYIVGELPDDGGNVTVADNCNAPQPWVGGSWNSGESFVATIGTQYYTSVAKAIEAAKENDVITLIADITASDIITINKPVTLDGKGKTLTSTAGRAINVDCEGNVGIKNLTINASGERAINVIQKPAKVTIEGVTATAANYTVNLASSAGAAEVAISNSNLTGLNVVNVAAPGSNVTISGGTITCNDQNANENYAALTLNKDAKNGKITAAGVEFNIEGNSRKATNQAEGGIITIDGSADEVEQHVAYISYGNNWYGFATLEAAIAKANAGETVTLLRNVTVDQPVAINKAITLDGNSKTLTYTGASRAITVDNNADADIDVTIKNLTINNTASYTERGINYNENGTLTLENVTVNGEHTTYAINLPGMSQNAKVVITGSKFTGLIALNIWGANTQVTAENSEFYSVDHSAAEGYAAIKLNNNGEIAADNATVVINGGKVIAKDENGAASIAVDDCTNGSTVTISATTEVVGSTTKSVAIISYGSQFYSFSTIEEAIAMAKDNETIELISDVTISYGARDLLATAAANKAVTIDGKGHTLTLNQTNSDWASIGLENNNKLVLKNMTIEKTGYGDTSGAWNTHAIIFSTAVEMENVTVNNSVAVQAGATLNNVTIKEANGYYGLWINGNGQAVTVNGGSITATNGGRGIKIADQYIDAPAKVTLNVTGTKFTTAKKAAVLVSSKAGAEITAANVNIENVAEDKVNFVWVDGDWATYFGNVTVNGAPAVMEDATSFVAAVTVNGAVQAYYKTIAEAIDAAEAGATVTILAGDYTGNLNVNKGITVQGEVDAEGKNLVTFNGKLNITANGAAVKNIDVKNSGTAAYINAADVLVENCNLEGSNGLYQSYAKGTVTFKNSVITGGTYGVHFDGSTGGNIVIEGCTITGWTSFAGTIANVEISKTTFADGNYNQLRFYQNATITECTFNEKMTVDFGKNEVEAEFTNCTVENGGDLTDVIYLGDIADMGVKVTIDGNPVCVQAKVGGNYYQTILEAVEAAKTGETVTVLTDVNVDTKNCVTCGGYSSIFNVKGIELTFDLNGHTITVVADPADFADGKAKGNMLMGVFTVDEGGKLTIDNSSDDKTGAVNVSANGATVYSLAAAYGKDAKLTINNGSYYVDEMPEATSLIYAQHSECVIINGGTYNIGNVGTMANGSPWIFNTKGQNMDGIYVNGGTYPNDINHQFWFNEAIVPGNLAVKANENGTWSVVEAVAYTNEVGRSTGSWRRNVGYATIEEAIAATKMYNCEGNVVTLAKNVEIEQMITVANGVEVTLDLNGKTLAATDKTSKNYSAIDNRGDLTIVDSSEGETGKITVTATVNSGWNRYSAVIANNPGGELTVNGGTIEHLGGTAMAWGIDNLTNGEGTYAETVINGGVVKSEYIAIRQFLNGVKAKNILTVNGGTLEGETASLYFQDPSAKANTGTLNVLDGTLAGDVYLDVTAGSTEWPVEVYIAKDALGQNVIHAENVPADAAALVEYDTFWQVEQKNLAELTIEDACDEYINKIVKNVGVLTYERYFDDTEWQTIVLPFDVPVANLMDQFEVAYIYNASYKGKQATIDYVEIEDAEFVLAANYPYLVKAKATGWNNIVVENAKLMPTKAQILDCSSIFEKFSFIGNYATVNADDLDATKGYFSLNGTWSKMETINPFRFYMQIELRNSAAAAFEYPTEAQAIRMRSVNANGEETTGIDGVDAEQAGDFIFDLHGRRVLETEKGGIYIKGGKKFIAQ